MGWLEFAIIRLSNFEIIEGETLLMESFSKACNLSEMEGVTINLSLNTIYYFFILHINGFILTGKAEEKLRENL